MVYSFETTGRGDENIEKLKAFMLCLFFFLNAMFLHV